MRQLTYQVAVSLDGYIAAAGGSFDAFAQTGDHIDALLDEWPETMPGHVLAALGVEATTNTFDTVIMGWNTFAVGLPHGIDSPYPHLRQYVLSRAPPRGCGRRRRACVRRSDCPGSLLKGEPGAGIWLCGGGVVAAAVRDEIDRLVLKINPVMLGDGIPLFQPGPAPTRSFQLESSRRFDSGVLMAAYRASGC